MWLVFKYESANDNLINHRYLSYNKNYSNKIDEKLKNWFKNTFKFSSNYINEFILFLRKGVYSHEFMDYCGKFSETVFPEKKVCSNLNMEHTTDSGDNHAKRTFQIKISVNIMICILQVTHYYKFMFLKTLEKCA